VENFILFLQPLSPFERGEHFIFYFCEPPFFSKTLKMYHRYTFSLPLPTTFSFGKDVSFKIYFSLELIIKFSSIFNILLLGLSQNPHNLTIMFTKMEIIHVCVGPFKLTYCPIPILDMYHFIFTLSMFTCFMFRII